MTIKVALIGAGSMASPHIAALQGQPGVSVVGICNRTVGRARPLADEYGIPVVTDCVSELWERTRADLVVLAVYETAILSSALSAFRYPWAVMMEKPVGLNLQEAEKIGSAAKLRLEPVFVGLNRRHYSSTRAVRHFLREHDGERFVHVQDQQSIPIARSLGHSEEVVSNWMFANSVHLVDYLRIFSRGSVVEMQHLERWNPSNPSRVIAHLRFESGDTAIYEAHWNSPAPWACTVSTPDGRWELKPLESARFTPRNERRPVEQEVAKCDVEFKAGFLRQAAETVAALRGEPSEAVALGDALETTRMVARIYGQS